MQIFRLNPSLGRHKCFACLGVVCSLLVTFAHGDSTNLVSEDFQRYGDAAALRKVWVSNELAHIVQVPGNHGRTAFHPGGIASRITGLAAEATETHKIVLSADIYDFGTNSNKRITVGLRNTNSAILEMGHYNAGGPYMVRLLGFGRSPGWRSFDTNQSAIRGWHRYTAVITRTNTVFTLDLHADGTIDKIIENQGPSTGIVFTELRFGGPSDVASLGGGALFDNLKLDLVPYANPGVVPAPSPTETAAPNPVPHPPSATPTDTPKAHPEPGSLSAVALGLIIGIALIVLLLGALLFVVLRRLSQPATLPPVVISTTGSFEKELQRRMLGKQAGEPGAPPPTVLTMTPALEEFAKQSLVQGLYTQRQELIETQAKARSELAALEARLAELQAPLQDRIRAYEQRISELEKELQTRGVEVRELVNATLILVRQKLEEERAKDQRRFN